MGLRLKTGYLLLIIGLLCLSFFVAIVPKVAAQQTVLNDNFTTDSTLNTSLWAKNGPSGTQFFTHVSNNVVNLGGSSLSLIDPNPTFSTQGMGINSINGPWTLTTIESVNAFTVPLTVQASVMATQSGGAAFCLWLRNDQQQIIVGFDGDLNSGAPMYGIWNDFSPNFWVTSLNSSPHLNTVYQLTISVNSGGDASVSLSANGQNLGSVSGEHIGTEPLKILLGQYEFYEGNTGTGANQAYWKSVTATSSSSTITPTPTSPSSSSNPTSTPTVKPTPTSSSTVSPTPSSGLTPTPSASSSPTASSSSTPTQSPEASTSPPTGASVSIPITIAVVTIVAPASIVVAFLAYKSRKTKQLGERAHEGLIGTGLFLSLFLSVLFFADFAINLTPSLYNVNMLDIASTLHVTVGTAGQIAAIARLVGIFVGLSMGLFSVRFKHKSLLLLGQVFVALGAFGSYFAPDFASFVFFQSVMGVGGPMVGIMAITLVGELMPLEKRGMAVGLLTSTLFVAGIVAAPVTGMISASYNWRFVLLWWIFPVAIASMILCFFILPSKPSQDQHASRPPYLSAFKTVLLNKSAVACMLSVMCAYAMLQLTAYAVTFYRINFGVSITTGSYISTAGAAFAASGAILGGRLVNPKRRRPLIIIALCISALLTMSFSFMPNLWSTLTLRYASAVIGSLSSAALATLVLEQVPKFRGTMMSLNSAIGSGFGTVLGLTLGGWVLNFSGNNYQMLFVTLGIFGIASSALVLFLTKDPTKTQPKR
jgi:predicted MFS family arabinose efflux permease